MASEYAEFSSLFQISSECILVSIRGASSEQEDFLVRLNPKCLEGDNDRNILVNRVVTKVYLALLGGYIRFGLETAVG